MFLKRLCELCMRKQLSETVPSIARKKKIHISDKLESVPSCSKPMWLSGDPFLTSAFVHSFTDI